MTAKKKQRAKKRTSAGTLKDFFIPHAGNNHAPHILHPKRAALYGGVFVAAKALVVATILLLPLQAYLTPDMLAEQERELNLLINELRAEHNLPTLAANNALEFSSQLKATDMARHAYFSHTGPDSRDFKYFMRESGYEYRLAGENLAMGFATPREVVAAWVKSPLHYKNLTEGEFVEMGLGLDSGVYRGEDTVFIANHFGSPLALTSALTAAAPAGRPGAVTAAGEGVLGEQSAGVYQNAYDKTSSHVLWKSDGNETTLTAKAFITGSPRVVNVTASGYDIVLEPLADGVYAGTRTVAVPVDDFFQVTLDPSIAITFPGEVTLIDSIPWYEVKVVGQTAAARYANARHFLPGPLGPLFATERALYILGISFFALALLVNVLVEVRTQRPHVIIPTGLVIVLLVMLLAV